MTNGSAERARALPGRLTASPVKVTTRVRSRFAANHGAFNGIRRTDVLHQHANIRSARRGELPVFPVSIWVSCFAPPEGYLVGITRNEMSRGVSQYGAAWEIACGLLSSMPINTSRGCRICAGMRIPSTICAAQSASNDRPP